MHLDSKIFVDGIIIIINENLVCCIYYIERYYVCVRMCRVRVDYISRPDAHISFGTDYFLLRFSLFASSYRKMT